MNLLDKSKNDFIEMLKQSKYDGFEDMVHRLEITKNDIIGILGMKYIPTLTIGGYTLPIVIYESRDIDFLLEVLWPNDVEKKLQLIILD